MGLPNPPRYRIAFSLFYFGLQQYFQIAEMTLLFLYGLLRHLRKLSTQGRQLQSLGILPNRRLLYRNGGRTH